MPRAETFRRASFVPTCRNVAAVGTGLKFHASRGENERRIDEITDIIYPYLASGKAVRSEEARRRLVSLAGEKRVASRRLSSTPGFGGFSPSIIAIDVHDSLFELALL